MNTFNAIVVSNQIHKLQFIKSKSLLASFMVHASIIAALSLVMTQYQVSKDENKQRLSISLEDFHESAGDIDRLESSSVLMPIVKITKENDSNLYQPTKILQPAPLYEEKPQISPTLERTPSPTPSVSPEASAPLALDQKPTSPSSLKSVNSPPVTSQTSVHEAPTSPALGNEIGGAALGHIRALIEKAIVYPTVARKLRLEGIVTVFFILQPDGSVETAKVSSTSGSRVLDEKAIQTIFSLSGDYPRLGKTVELTIPIAFNLQKF